MNSFENILAHLREQAFEAGNIMRHFYRNPACRVYIKPDGSKVTDADLTISKMVQERASHFPNILLYSEETNPKPAIEAGKNYFIVDELDGTSLFADGLNGFAHLAAYYDAKEGFAVGVLYYPLEDILLYSLKGKGAFMEEKGEQKPLNTPPHKDLQALRYAHSLQYKGNKYKNLYARLKIGEDRIVYTQGILRTLDIVRGDLDVAVILQPYTAPWDIAAEKAFVDALGFNYSYLNGADVIFTDQRAQNNAGYLICPKPWRETLSRMILEQ